MRDRNLEAFLKIRDQRQLAFESLMQHRVQNVMLVSSLYDSFTVQEDGRLTEALFSDYLQLNLQYRPYIVRVSTAEEALEKLIIKPFDLIISMMRVGEIDVLDFSRRVSEMAPDVPLVLMAYNTRELSWLQNLDPPGVDRTFAWLGDVRLFIAIIKYIEDRLNAWHDARTAGVQSILLIEDNPRFYSMYLPLLYTEIVEQTQALMSDGLNRLDKLTRMRARPKILLATNYEDGEKIFERQKKYLSGVILDAAFPKEGKMDRHAGIHFAKRVRAEIPDRPILIQSTDIQNEMLAIQLGAQFINKRSPKLLYDVRQFMGDHLGFGDFVFRSSDRTEVARAGDLHNFTKELAALPADALLYHSNRNDFSTWLMTRTEFGLAKALRPVKASAFATPEELRKHLLDKITYYRHRPRAGVIVEFSPDSFVASSAFMRIGTGSLGGKGRGLAFLHALFERYKIEDQLSDIKIGVPPTAVLATGVFDEFMKKSKLHKLVLGDCTDEEVTQAFLNAPLPDQAKENLRSFLQGVTYPLAVRSSSLLEDTSHQPFAGVYRTCMIPNNHPDLDVRLRQLSNAVRLVYASTYQSDARGYIKSTPSRLEEEKMAVLIQQVVGRRWGDYLYPDVAGVARSHDVYPMEGMKPTDGVASVSLGLGKMVVEGGRALRFSPAEPRRLYQFSSVDETLKNSQREFYALDLGTSNLNLSEQHPDSAITTLDLATAEEHGTLASVGSVYSAENDAVYDGTSRAGVRLVTMAGVLKAGICPLAETLQLLLQVGTASFSGPVEIEFALNLKDNADHPNEFSVLQIRPIVLSSDTQELNLDGIQEEEVICYSKKALGNGVIEDIRDIVYVRRQGFDRAETVAIADEIGGINNKLGQEERPYLLIGPGRWGSSDRWLGIPVTWKQISGVGCIVETDMDDIPVTPSQGTHFFQNITSFGIGYFTVNFGSLGGVLDYDWMDSQPAQTETEHVRHLRFPEPLNIAVNGRRSVGAVLKPGHSFPKFSRIPTVPYA